jgi:hypothetical protein
MTTTMTDARKQKGVDETILADLLERIGIYGLLTMLAEAVRKQGKRRQKETILPVRLKHYIKLSEEIAKNIEKARDAT